MAHRLQLLAYRVEAFDKRINLWPLLLGIAATIMLAAKGPILWVLVAISGR